MFRKFVIIFILISSFIFGAEDIQKAKTICLNMIVKNESDVIERCLESTLPIIDTWVIVDTGSNDGTQEIIRDFMRKKGVPGTLYERPWKNFEHNRNEALQLAKGRADYTFFIDADEYLVFDKKFNLPDLEKDFYHIKMEGAGLNYMRSALIKDALSWRWEGVLHEVITCPDVETWEVLPHVTNFFTSDGARAKDPDKFLKDAKVLEDALAENPDNSRYVFYLAQSYKCAGEIEKAIETYQKRVSMGGWDQEVYWSYLQIAICQEMIGESLEVVYRSFQRASDYRSFRPEPIYHLARIHRTKNEYQEAYRIACCLDKLPENHDTLFVQQWVVDYGIPFERSIAAYYVGEYEESKRLCEELLSKEDVPQVIKDYSAINLKFAEEKAKLKYLSDVGIPVVL